MSSNKPPVEKWTSMSPKEFYGSLPRKTFGMRLVNTWNKLKSNILKRAGCRTISGYRGHVHGGHHYVHHTPSQDFRASQQVQTPRTPTWDERVWEQVQIHNIIRDTDGIPNDYQKNDCGPEL